MIAVDDPLRDDVRALLERHLAYARGNSPREDAHALDVEALADPAITFYAYRDRGGRVLAVGALRRIDDGHAEIKSRHTAEEARGSGIGTAMLEHLLAEARAAGHARVSLETGAQPAFAPARALYARAGFEPCAPFADYRESPNSAYMRLDLQGPGEAHDHAATGRSGSDAAA